MTNIFVETYGCAANFCEGEMIKGILKKDSFEIVDSKQNADLIILNICTVKGNNVALRIIKKTYREFPDKKMIIAGCVPAEFVFQIQKEFPTASIANTHNIHKIVEAVKQTLLNSPVKFIERSKEQKIELPRVRKNQVVGIIPISQGCDSACSFCSVKFIKGNHISYPAQKIIQELKNGIKDGCKEIWLTGQDTSCYGTDIGTNLPKLLQQLMNVEGYFKIRLGMANPKHVKNYAKELIEIYKHEKMFKFLHIPVQSGNNKILEQMKRGYTVKEFEKIVDDFRKEMPEITLSTDIICGFPGETMAQFEDSLNFVKKIKFDAVNISRFEARQGTLAAKMQQQISGQDKKTRSQAITNAFVWGAFEQNKKWKNWQGEIIIDAVGKHNTSLGRNYAYKQVVVQGKYNLGQRIKTRITDITATYLRGTQI